MHIANDLMAGARQAMTRPLSGHWSPTCRALMVGVGAGLFAYGLTRSAPLACVLGTVGLALAAEGISNADLSEAAHTVAEHARCTMNKLRGNHHQDHPEMAGVF